MYVFACICCSWPFPGSLEMLIRSPSIRMNVELGRCSSGRSCRATARYSKDRAKAPPNLPGCLRVCLNCRILSPIFSGYVKLRGQVPTQPLAEARRRKLPTNKCRVTASLSRLGCRHHHSFSLVYPAKRHAELSPSGWI